jgi:hypothetical protein
MNDIVLVCCGEAVPPPPGDIDCPACGTHFTAGQTEQLQMREIQDIPMVDVRCAARMFNQTQQWIFERRQVLKPIHGYRGLDFVFPLAAIRRFATEQKLTLTPRPIVNGVLWVPSRQD